jgi:hypothetical protein
LATGVRAAPTALGTLLHQIIAAGHFVTVGCARVADLRADATGPRMEFRTKQHESGARVADLGTRGQQLDVFGPSVLAAEFDAMIKSLETDRLTTLTTIDTLVGSWVNMVGHCLLLPSKRTYPLK